jgi:alkaline phosphatase D
MKNIKMTRRGALLGAAGAGLAVGACSGPRRYEPPAMDGHFRHGVASGDPDPSSVVLWTALSDDGGGYRGVEVARDEAFADIVFETGDDIQYVMPQSLGTWKYIATGLEPGQTYFYRFRFNDTYSPVGITRTLPEGAVDAYTIGVLSCANYPTGFFNVYREAADNGDLDLVVHLGDYFYEYAMGEYATGDAEALNRVPEPLHETVSREDYIARHAQYRTDPDLQALHAAAPWIMSWDDHETANNAYSSGAENHNEGEGDWDARRSAALRVWYDWTPTREPEVLEDRRAVFEIGDLATFILLESRLSARSVEITRSSFPLSAGADPEDPETQAALTAWRDEIGDPAREMLGSAQVDDIHAACAASVTAGKPWRILGNQVMMSRVTLPDFTQTLPGWLRWYATRDNAGVRNYIDSTRFDLPLNLDMWDGFPAERERLYAGLRAADADIITLTGDVHSFWTNDMADAHGTRIGTELVTSSVTSPSPFALFAAPGVDYAEMLTARNDEVTYTNVIDHGYVRLTLTHEAANAEYIKVSTISSPDYHASLDSEWRVTPARGGAVPQAERVG